MSKFSISHSPNLSAGSVGPTVLLVEDDNSIAEPLVFGLRQEGFEVVRSADGLDALNKALEIKPDLVLLDVMLPGIDGYEVCRRLRDQAHMPIIMLTARDQEMERVMGLEIGADDYLVKPFSFRELVARMRVHLRRAAPVSENAAARPPQQLTIGDITLDREGRQVFRRGQPVELSRREFDLLQTLMEHAGRALTRQELLDLVWGEAWVGNPRTLDVHMHWLREKLEDDPINPRYMETVYGYGYRFRVEAAE